MAFSNMRNSDQAGHGNLPTSQDETGLLNFKGFVNTSFSFLLCVLRGRYVIKEGGEKGMVQVRSGKMVYSDVFLADLGTLFDLR